MIMRTTAHSNADNNVGTVIMYIKYKQTMNKTRAYRNNLKNPNNVAENEEDDN